jgi:hypothetical protein
LTVDHSGVYVSGVDSISNYLQVVKLDSSGHYFGSTNVNQSSSGIISTKLNSQSQLYVCYTTDSSGVYNWSVSKFDSLINNSWTINYPDSSTVLCYPTSFVVLDDGFIVSGKIDPYISTVRFTETSTTQVEEQRDSQLIFWPNPAGEKFYFSNKINSGEKIIFNLYDLDGRCIAKNISISAISDRYMIELPNLNKGIYFFELWIGEKKYSDKIIIM